MATGHNQVVLLNRLLSRSVTTARGQTAPPHSGEELLDIVANQHRLGLALEFFGPGDSDDEEQRILNSGDYDHVALRDYKKEITPEAVFYILLIEYVNANHKSFPVVNRATRVGRELAGDADERGVAAIHVVIKLPANGSTDDGDYRCAIEYSPSVRRLDVEKLLCRQLKRVATRDDWTFPVGRIGRRGKPVKDAEYKYRARLELAADIGRAMGFGGARQQLAQVIFTKKLSKEEIHGPTHVKYVDSVLADLEVKVSGKQAPTDEEEKRGWLAGLREHYEHRGYTTRLLFRYAGGGTMSGEVDKAVAGAVDLIMCPKEYVPLEAERPRWCAQIDLPFADRMKALLSDDSLWQRAQQN